MINVTRFFRSKVAIAAAVLALTAVGSLTGAKSASAANPDLTVQRITVNNTTKGVTVRFHNATAASGNSFYTAIYVCNSTTWACQTYSRWHGAMAANTDGLVTATAFSGANWAYACVDIHPFIPVLSDRINESNEGNNCRLETFAPIP